MREGLKRNNNNKKKRSRKDIIRGEKIGKNGFDLA